MFSSSKELVRTFGLGFTGSGVLIGAVDTLIFSTALVADGSNLALLQKDIADFSAGAKIVGVDLAIGGALLLSSLIFPSRARYRY